MKAASVQCPTCGTPLSRKGGSRGLCPSCLLAMALDDTSIEAAALAEPEDGLVGQARAVTLDEGRVLGGRYRLRSLLGRGGMGDVWRAYDLKLRQDVALKALRPELIQDEEALLALRKEVRAARQVISPNVCRVFDLEELDGLELVLMEYIDGTTLQEVLRERSPLDLDEAREIASQFLAGLEAIHDAGLVHRDIKPENVMVTRTGRVVVMDFGISKGLGGGSSRLTTGTPPYMSPEQARGAEVDARSDVFSAGIVLAEMIEPGGVRAFDERQRLWEALHAEPPHLAETPWARLIRRCVSPPSDERFASAAELARALEEVTLRAAGDEQASPYPGLSVFQQEDATFFYGRELEVEALWKKLRRPHLMALIGPSGAGKSSFLRAGLLPTLTYGWRTLITTPGNKPFDHLARALPPELGEVAGVTELLRSIDEPDIAVELLTEWRRGYEHALFIVDQFEELFTQNPPEVQERFAELLGRLPLELDMFVLLSMRDDFLFRCHDFEALAPVFSEMTPLGPPTGASLRRAIVHPALKCGYRFEDESLVEAMLHVVEGERGSLPMVAFAMARLWEHRDRDQGYLTREAYDQIGGVSGALAQHAEATLGRIGEDRIPIVRELLRNLVTAQGTRAARDRNELLSVFEAAGAPVSVASPDHAPRSPGAPAASVERRVTEAQVLDSLIDARLLTSYEIRNKGDAPHHRVEIVHESLLSVWPRLVRWQTQDAEGAQLRDELRSQAQLWDQHGRNEDYLWTGTAYREYQLWRERYPGGLSRIEEAFADAMTALADRRRRRRQLAFTAVIASLLAVLSVVTWSRFEAKAEARRAEAAKLLAIAETRLGTDPTEALAFTISSLELADTEEARAFTVRALWAGPPAMVLDPEMGGDLPVPTFSPTGRWLSLAGQSREEVLVFDQAGGTPIVLDGHPSGHNAILASWSSESELATGHRAASHVRLWSFPGGELLREIHLGEGGVQYFWHADAGLLRGGFWSVEADSEQVQLHLRRCELPDGEVEDLGTVDWTALGATTAWLDFGGRTLLYAKGRKIFARPLPIRQDSRDRLIGRHDNQATSAWYRDYPSEPNRLWTQDAVTSELRLWSLSSPNPEPLEVVPRPSELEAGARLRVALGGRWLLDDSPTRDGKALLWDRSSIPRSSPTELRRSGSWYMSKLDIHPAEDWIVASTDGVSKLTFWPLQAPVPAVISGYDTFARKSVIFTPDSQWLVTYWGQDKLRLWPLPESGNHEIRELDVFPSSFHTRLAIDRAGQRVFDASAGVRLYVVPLDGSEPLHLEGFGLGTFIEKGAFSPSGRYAAAATMSSKDDWKLRVWDLESREVRVFDAPRPSIGSEVEGGRASQSAAYSINDLGFVSETTLLSGGPTGVLLWDLEDGSWEPLRTVEPGHLAGFRLSGELDKAITYSGSRDDCGPLLLHDLQVGASRELQTLFPCDGSSLAIDPSLSVMALGRDDGLIRVGRIENAPPHLLVGHEGPIEDLQISPDLKWIVSTAEDETIRLWPMPDLDKPPLHTLPHDELIAKLQSLTNLRAVPDEASSTGWSIEIGPFPGWKEVPPWW